MAYQRPMVTVDQNMTVAPASIERDMPAFVFGPNYELHRYSDDAEKPKTSLGEWVGDPIKKAYPGVADDEMVDKSYTKLFGDNVTVNLAKLAAGSGDAVLPEDNINNRGALFEANGGYTKILFPGKRWVVGYSSASRSPEAGESEGSLGADLAPGNVLVIRYKMSGDGADVKRQTIRTYITDVKYSAEPFEMDSSSESSEGAPGTMVTIADPLPSAVDAATITVNLAFVISGVEFSSKNVKIDEDDFSGDAGLWQWKQGYEGEDGKAKAGIDVETLAVDINPYDIKGYSDTNGALPVWGDVLMADLYVTTRELLTGYSDTFHSVESAPHVADVLGTVHPDNPLAMGVYMAALNAATDDGDEASPVYFMAVPTDDLEGYNEVLQKAEVNDKAYVFAPTTRLDSVLEATRNHVVSMSAKTVKQWRIAAGSADVPTETAKLSAADSPDGGDYVAIPVSDSGLMPVDEKTFKYIRVTQGADTTTGNPDTNFRSTVVKGDRIRFNYGENLWGEPTYKTYTVKRVINNYTLEIDTADDDCISTMHLTKAQGGTHYLPARVEVWHPYTVAETADVIASVSKAFALRRMLNVFPPEFENDGVLMSGEFAACAVAGLVSATEPQQPITNMPVRGIDNVPLTYQTYSRTQLDTIAAGGTFIVCQDLPHDKVYVRHQITTAYPDGNLNTAELSITKDVDFISYAFARVFEPYYGKYNVTTALLAKFENLAKNLVNELGRDTSVYGPKLIADETTIDYVRRNELMKDHVDIGLTLSVPYPCNNIDIVLTV